MPHRSLTDWLLLLALVAMWGSSFMFNKLGVATVPPATLVAGRLTLGALTLLALVYASGRQLPPPGRVWLAYAVLGIIGNCVPFYLIAWGQQVVDSALAGILMAVMPLATLLLAHFLVHGERMTFNRLAGFALGFVGIVFLMEPAAVAGIGGAPTLVLSQLAVLCGALCYSANSVLARLLIKSDFLVSATGTLLISSILVLPLALAVDRPWTAHPSFASTRGDRVARHRSDRDRDDSLLPPHQLRGSDFHVARELSEPRGRRVSRCDAARREAGRHGLRRACAHSRRHRAEPVAAPSSV